MWEIKACKKTDPDYPKQMMSLDSAPDTLYYVGDISLCNALIIAAIGKRDASERYKIISKRVGGLLARKGFVVLNGLARGCDTEVLEGAVEEKGKVIAVMPGGLDEVYPKLNKRLAEKIIENGGCLISEYPSGKRPQKHMFVERDKIQAMLSSKIFIIDAEKNSGTMHTAEYGMRYKKPLACYTEKISERSPEGNVFLIESKKAHSVRNTEDLMSFIEQL